ncbi:hypothetical protein ACQPYK_32660 [Streptosporangium sp. CA-135522]|uniref:hypothetical protein n=1 Tax=Streptosporangium sp. CA-135522 TaxID=3240072 RepID=UPI003D8BB1F4
MATLQERATCLESEFRALRTRCTPRGTVQAHEGPGIHPGQTSPDGPPRLERQP